MKSIVIKGSQRESVGKVATKALRNAGKVPCVLYGGDKPLHFSADEISFKNLVYTANVYTATIEIEGTNYHAILQDIQFHPVTDKILHVDFYQLFDDKLVAMNIPVRLIGNSPGVLNGGSLRFPMRKLSIRALPADLPDFINADIDILINLTCSNNFYTEYVFALSKAKFKVSGIIDCKYSDLNINYDRSKDLNYFITQVDHYLNTINKA